MDYFPGGNEPILPPDGAGRWLQHAKLNVVRGVKRGLSDFTRLMAAWISRRRVLRNMGEGSAVQAAIAWIQEVAPGTTQAQTHSGTLSRADASYTTLSQRRQSHASRPAIRPGHDFESASRPEVFAWPARNAARAEFYYGRRSIATYRRSALEPAGELDHRLGGEQQLCLEPRSRVAVRQVRRITTTVLRPSAIAKPSGASSTSPGKPAASAMSLGRNSNAPLDITITPPQVEVRDPEKETRVRQILNAAGVLSKKTWAAQESLDFDEEQKNLRQEAADSQSTEKDSAANVATAQKAGHLPQSKATSPPPLDDAPDASEPPDARMSAESLEAWDASKHPRGGHAQNAGWFSKVFSRGKALRKLFGHEDQRGALRHPRNQRQQRATGDRPVVRFQTVSHPTSRDGESAQQRTRARIVAPRISASEHSGSAHAAGDQRYRGDRRRHWSRGTRPSRVGRRPRSVTPQR